MPVVVNPFPELLTFGILAPTLLRLAAGVAFLYLAYKQYDRREEIAALDLPFVGKSSWWYIVSVLFNTVVGAMLICGFYTQIAALLGVAGQCKGIWLNYRYPRMVIFSNAAVLLLIAILCSLLLTGAGLIAIDIPL